MRLFYNFLSFHSPTILLSCTIVGFADLEVGVILAEDVGDPEATDVVGEGFGGHEAQAVLLGDVFEFNRCITHVVQLFFFLLVNQKRGSMTPSVQCKYLIACS